MTRIASSLTALIFAASCFVAAAQDPTPTPSTDVYWELPADPDAVVVRYQRVIAELEDTDRGPSVTIRANGRMTVHYPRYMKRAGDYETFLGRDQVEAIVNSLIDKQVADVDPRAVGAQAEALAADKLVWASDYTTTVIELNLDNVQPAGETSESPRTLQKTIRWQGLQSQARHHPSVRALQDLAAAARELEALMTHEALERIDR